MRRRRCFYFAAVVSLWSLSVAAFPYGAGRITMPSGPGEWRTAVIKTIEREYQRQPSAFLARAIAVQLEEQDQASEAVRWYQAAMRLDPGNPHDRVGLARSLTWVGPETATLAASEMREALRLAPNDPVVLREAGIFFCYYGGDLEEGERLIRRALELRPKDVRNMAALAGVAYYARSGETAETIRLYEEALELRPNLPWLLVEYGQFLASVMDEVTRAAELAERALKLRPNDLSAQALKGYCLFAEDKDLNRARQLLRRAYFGGVDWAGSFLGILTLRESESAYISLLQEARRMTDPRLMVTLVEALDSVEELEPGTLEAASSFMQRTLELGRRQFVEHLLVASRVRFRLADFAGALELAQEALKLAREQRASSEEIKDLEELVEFYREMGQP